jgi:hypothetical protein
MEHNNIGSSDIEKGTIMQSVIVDCDNTMIKVIDTDAWAFDANAEVSLSLDQNEDPT